MTLLEKAKMLVNLLDAGKPEHSLSVTSLDTAVTELAEEIAKTEKKVTKK